MSKQCFHTKQSMNNVTAHCEIEGFIVIVNRENCGKMKASKAMVVLSQDVISVKITSSVMLG